MRTGTAMSRKEICVEACFADEPGEGLIQRGVSDSPSGWGHEETRSLWLRAQLVALVHVHPEGLDRGGVNRYLS